MVKMSAGIQKVRRWLMMIGKPQDKLNGMAICPFIKKYMDKVYIIEAEDYYEQGTVACEMIHPLNFEAVVISGPIISYDRLNKIHNTLNKKYKHRDIEVLFMHPDTEEPPLPLEYNFTQPLLIVQKRSTLEESRKILHKSGKYYDLYK